MLAPDSYPHVTCGCTVRGQRAGRRAPGRRLWSAPRDAAVQQHRRALELWATGSRMDLPADLGPGLRDADTADTRDVDLGRWAVCCKLHAGRSWARPLGSRAEASVPA